VNPANQPKERGFDFSRDYVVWNRLGQTLYQRAQLEAPGTDSHQKFLADSVKAYLRVLAEESEDQEAHYGISQALADIAGDKAVPSAAPGPDEACLTGDQLIEMARQAGQEQPFEKRESPIQLMGQAIAGWASMTPNPSTPRWSPLRRALKPLDDAMEKALDGGADPRTRVALAGILAQGHRLAHTLLKPDDLARAKTTTAFRAKHAAANAAAEAIILYPTAGEPTWKKP
jgi:hypothetical protein